MEKSPTVGRQEGSKVGSLDDRKGAGGGGFAAAAPSVHKSIRAGRFVVDGERFCRLGHIGVGPFWRKACDAEAVGRIAYGTDYVVRSGKSLWSVDGLAQVLVLAGFDFVRKEKALPGQMTLEDVLTPVMDELAEMAPDDGTRLLHVKEWSQAPRWIEGQLLGSKRWVRGIAGVARPAIGTVVRVVPLEAEKKADLCDVWTVLPGTLTTSGGVW